MKKLVLLISFLIVGINLFSADEKVREPQITANSTYERISKAWKDVPKKVMTVDGKDIDSDELLIYMIKNEIPINVKNSKTVIESARYGLHDFINMIALFKGIYPDGKNLITTDLKDKLLKIYEIKFNSWKNKPAKTYLDWVNSMHLDLDELNNLKAQRFLILQWETKVFNSMTITEDQIKNYYELNKDIEFISDKPSEYLPLDDKLKKQIETTLKLNELENIMQTKIAEGLQKLNIKILL